MRSLMPILCIIPLFFGCTGEQQTVSFPTLPNIESTSGSSPTTRSSEPTETKEFVLSLVGEVRGEIEPCGCPTLPYGGFVRRTAALQEVLNGHTVFQLDAGEALLKGFFSNKGNTSIDRALLIGELSKDIGVDVWTVGPSDLIAVGMETLQTMTGPPRISATWYNNEGQRYFEPFKVISKDNIQIAVIGLSTHPTDPRYQFIETKSAKETLAALLPDIPSDIDMIVALGSMDDEEISDLQYTFPSIALFLSTEGANYEDPQHKPNSTQIIEAPKQGRFIQNIYIRQTQPKGLLYNDVNEADWRTWLMVKDDPTHTVHQTLTEKGQRKNLYFTELIPLSATFDRTDTASQEKIASFAQSTIQKSQAIAEQPTTTTDPGFAASGRCAQCHTAEMAKWSFTNHSRAWESLLTHPVEGSTTNPDCIGCHTTGFGEVGGFGEPSTSNLRKFKAVQCEACHGPLKGHPNDKSIQPTPISKDTCLGCHDAANSPDFDFDTYLRKATCQSK